MENAQECAKIELNGDLTIKQSDDIKNKILLGLDEHKKISLKIDDDVLVDLSFIQLIESSRHYAANNGGSIKLTKPSSQNIHDVLERGGFLDGFTNEDRNFWFHQEVK